MQIVMSPITTSSLAHPMRRKIPVRTRQRSDRSWSPSWAKWSEFL